MGIVFETSEPGGGWFRVLDMTKVAGLGLEARNGLADGVRGLVEYERERLGEERG